MIGVYYLVNTTNGRFYIGSSGKLRKRSIKHKTRIENHEHENVFVREDSKLGHEFKFVIKVITETRKEAYEHEQRLITENKDNPLMYNIGLNVTGGDNLTRHPDRADILQRRTTTVTKKMERMSVEERKAKYGKSGQLNGMYGRTHTEEVKRALSERFRGVPNPKAGKSLTEDGRRRISEYGKTRTGVRNSFFGKTHSKETRAKLAEKQRGVKPANSLKVSIEGVVYDSYHDASVAIGKNVTVIRWRALSKNPKYANWFLV